MEPFGPTSFAAHPPGSVGDAFREVHVRRLHAFALLIAVGDAPMAARLAGEAMRAAVPHIPALRHPERAAAWLRRHVVDGAQRAVRSDPPTTEHRAMLGALGIDETTQDALRALPVRERAVLICAEIEGLDRRDVGDVVRRSGARLCRLTTKARRQYLRAYVTGAPDSRRTGGPLAARVRRMASGGSR